jgi:alcohol dehydrogenase (cytochrome c)
MGAYYFKGEAKYVAGKEFMAGGEQALLGDEAYGAVRALDVLTGKLTWEFRLQSPLWSGVLSTAGGLVFGAQTKAVSSHSTLKQGSRCGTFKLAALFGPTPSHSQ